MNDNGCFAVGVEFLINDGRFFVARNLTTPQSKLTFAGTPDKGRHVAVITFSLVL